MAFVLQLRGVDDFKMDSHKEIRWVGGGEAPWYFRNMYDIQHGQNPTVSHFKV